MKNSYKKLLPVYVGSTCIIISFFLGYMFAVEKYKLDEHKYLDTIRYVDVHTTTKKIEIKNAPENIIFRVNGELFKTGSIDLK